MKGAKRIALALLALSAWLAFASQAASAAPSPVWRLSASMQPTNLAAGEANDGSYPLYTFAATNIGGAPASGPFTITATLPGGITPTALESGCTFTAPTLTLACTYPGPIVSGQNKGVLVPVKVGAPLAEGETAITQVKISGGGAKDAGTSITTPITSALPEFGFLPGPNGFSAIASGLDGSPVTLAGSHPGQLTVDLGFPSKRLGGEGEITGAGGGLRDLIGHGPKGFAGNPTATPVRCPEALLEARACPIDSAIGVVTVLTTGTPGSPLPSQSPLFSMVTPAGMPAEFGFDAAGVGIFVHVKASVRTDGDYGVDLTTSDTLARAPNPVLAAQLQLWGDPSDPAHDRVRGACDEEVGPELCPVPAQETAFLAMPTHCAGSLSLGAEADSWLEPGVFKATSAPLTDAAGNPTPVEGCEELDFNPTITAKPTTTLADSPSGLDVVLHQPQETKLKDEEGNPARATAILKDATLTLPEGMTVNPSQADGLGACTIAQAGLTTKVGESPVHFNKEAAACPDSAKIGSLEVSSPLLAETEAEGTKVKKDEAGNPIPRPLQGSVYIAQPYQNPFGSLLAVYLTIDDPQSGIVAKLAGEVHADSVSGRLTTTFKENPELPIEDVAVHLFAGNRAPLRTPPACATYTTQAALTSWSAPDETTQATDSFGVNASPATASCPTTAQGAPNAASFEAGTLTPKAGAFSPLALKLSRGDGTQPPAGFETILPRGLVAKLAGVPYCPEAGIARARSREAPSQGAAELSDPSCPAASQVGTVDVGAGAGPTPFHTQGKAYLAGPYKGAPLSVVVITPAIAGPFDLGDVVVRAATYLDPESAQARAVSDPLPTILQGIPLDLRSLALSLNRPDFTLNPTSCDPSQVNARLTSLFGGVLSLQSRFQVGGCSALPFKPKLSIRLTGKTNRGAHPSLRAVLSAKPGEAGIARTSVALPRSEFIDQAHFRTICTRVQFAANQCPAGSVYGHVTATSPLVDYPLEGPVYLRSSSHKLPDVVAALRGPASQPVEIDIDGRVDSVNGGIRTTFEALPDAPVSKVTFSLQGGKKGLFQNSTSICAATFRATVKMTGQNGKRNDFSPVVRASGCGKSSKQKKKGPAKAHR